MSQSPAPQATTQPQPSPQVQPQPQAPQVPPAAGTGTQAQPQATEIPKEQQELLNVMNELLMAAQELSYTVALVPNQLIEQHEELKDLVEAARNVVKATYKFYKLIKRRGRR